MTFTQEKFSPREIGGLNHETELLIKQSREGACGVDLPKVAEFTTRTGQKNREQIGLAQVNEPTVIRHFVRLSNQNYSIDAGFYPLGSCTMKHNPRLNEKMARSHRRHRGRSGGDYRRSRCRR